MTQSQKPLSQSQLVIQHLTNIGTLEPLQALREYGIYRLGARISELRRAGYAISKTWITTKSRITGRDVRFAQYSMDNGNAMPEAVRGQEKK
ncbi:MAG: helix-turn-helix domain-containing protein [Bacteroidaceae bacterium]|nr:helix-turn-helix domain-containing protein [Bacteroidaceae bacterium]